MQHDEFIGRVQNRARLASHGEAAAATRATLETLGERLERGLAQHVSSQLPPEIGQHLPTCRPFERVSIREGVDRSKAIQHARAVLEVLKDTTQGVLDKVRQSLPDEFRTLFDRAVAPGEGSFFVASSREGALRMKHVRLPLPEIGLIAATRGMLGAGIAFLLADKLSKDRRRAVGWTLFLVGAASTVPLVRDVLGKRQTC